MNYLQLKNEIRIEIESTLARYWSNPSEPVNQSQARVARPATNLVEFRRNRRRPRVPPQYGYSTGRWRFMGDSLGRR